jgi:hypothetical protein
VAGEREERETVPGSPICSGLHATAESAPVLVSPIDAVAAAVTGRGMPMLNRVFGVTGVRVSKLYPGYR